ncbi:hemin uptake protein HemP [soil metagenome]
MNMMDRNTPRLDDRLPSNGSPAPFARGLRLDRQEPSPAVLRVSSDDLFAGSAEVQIEHHGAIYRLKHTSLGKLILTK